MTTTLPVQEHKLVTWARDAVATSVSTNAVVGTAMVSAEAVKGIVITDATQAQIAEDHAAAIKRGQQALATAKRPLLDLLNGMKAAIAAYLEPTTNALDRAIAEINAAQSGYARRLREEAERLERERRIAAEAAAKAEAERIAAEVEAARQMALDAGAPLEAAEAAALQTARQLTDESLPLEEPPAPVPTATVRGSSTQSVVTKVMKAEIVNLADVDPVLVDLRLKDACDVARREIRRENMREPGIGRENAVILGGVRYWFEESRSRRGL